MTFNPEIHHRRSIRLRDYDYSQNGAYFVTVVAKNREDLFGEMENGEMILNDTGKMVLYCWEQIPEHFPDVEIDECCVMPNHFHGIFLINCNRRGVGCKGERFFAPTDSGTSKTVGSIVRGFKIGVTKWARKNLEIIDVWQRNYYEHVIRNESDLEKIRQYIFDNPANWENDENNVRAKDFSPKETITDHVRAKDFSPLR
jgi:REP element-mobilizing transposase RayT